jgi:hypothetical protein
MAAVAGPRGMEVVHVAIRGPTLLTDHHREYGVRITLKR